MNTLRLTQSNCWLWLFITTLLLVGCQSAPKNLQGQALSQQALHATVSAAFAMDGRLWRVIPTENAVYVDSSTDNGKTFGAPVRINPQDQHINVWEENPPVIEVGGNGHIYLLFYADEKQRATTYFSFSSDNGKSFSKPVLVSDHAQTARNYMDRMLIDKNGKLFLFWHDTRHQQHTHHSSSEGLSLYYSTTDNPASGEFSNQRLSDDVCSCCRTAVALAANNKPLLLARMVFADGARDHALIALRDNGQWSQPQRVTYDDWKVSACPEHGPYLAIDAQGRAHFAWFTQGEKRQGVYYAYTDDEGKTVSKPMPLGDKNRLAGHPAVYAQDDRVAVVWQEFDGRQTEVWGQTSADRGKTWSLARVIGKTVGKASYPQLIGNRQQMFLSWGTAEGHQLIEIGN